MGGADGRDQWVGLMGGSVSGADGRDEWVGLMGGPLGGADGRAIGWGLWDVDMVPLELGL